MMKGIAQSKRDSAWHTRHTQSLAKKRLARRNLLMSRKHQESGKIRKIRETERMLAERKKTQRVGITGFVKSTFSAMWSRIKSLLSRFVSSSHGTNAPQNA